jgi:4-hydroxy-tetrahydrodipicolinate synthase
VSLYRGLVQIIITPFHGDGSLDLPGLRALTRDALEAGAAALTILGVSSEAAFVDEDERRKIVRTILEVNDGALPVIVGITGDDDEVVAQRAREAQTLDAAAVMLAPPREAGSLTARYERVAEAAPGLSIVLQDFPAVGHPPLDAGALLELVRAVPAVKAVYHEDAPTPVKIHAVRAIDPALPQICGLGALWLPWELRAGATALMTGYAFPRLTAAAMEAALGGDVRASDAIHTEGLPSIAWEAQPRVGIAHRKAMLVERGVIASPRLRAPVPPVPAAAAEATALAAALDPRWSR